MDNGPTTLVRYASPRRVWYSKNIKDALGYSADSVEAVTMRELIEKNSAIFANLTSTPSKKWAKRSAEYLGKIADRLPVTEALILGAPVTEKEIVLYRAFAKDFVSPFTMICEVAEDFVEDKDNGHIAAYTVPENTPMFAVYMINAFPHKGEILLARDAQIVQCEIDRSTL